MVEIYVKLIRAGVKTIKDVPEVLRGEVKGLLENE